MFGDKKDVLDDPEKVFETEILEEEEKKKYKSKKKVIVKKDCSIEDIKEYIRDNQGSKTLTEDLKSKYGIDHVSWGGNPAKINMIKINNKNIKI